MKTLIALIAAASLALGGCSLSSSDISGGSAWKDGVFSTPSNAGSPEAADGEGQGGDGEGDNP